MQQYKPSVIEVCQFCKDHRLNAELVGRWVWVKFDAKPDAETRKLMKDFGFRWVARRGMWAHNCGHPSRSGKRHPFYTYGHRPVSQLDTESLTAA